MSSNSAPTVPPSASARTSAPLRVAFCIDNMNVGGTEMNAVRTAERLVERGVELRVFSLATQGPLLERYAEMSVPVHFLPLDGLFSRSALAHGRVLVDLVRRHGVDVVHAHDFYSNIFAGFWTRAAGAAFVASRRWWEGPARLSQRMANRLSYAVATRVLANSESVAAMLSSKERVPARCVAVVRNFVDEDAFTAPDAAWLDAVASELQLPGDRTVVGVVASLQPIKNHAMLLKAVAQLTDVPGLYLILVGRDYGMREQLEALAIELGIRDRLRFAGLRPIVPSMHYFFDISVLTSVSEGLPNSILEAMAAGRPVVATDVGAIRDAVADGVSGYLVPSGDADALAGRLRALSADPDARRQFGREGRSRAQSLYSAQAAMTSLMELYADAAAASRRRRSA
jgi:glycosyltransferase involved in cell wall biosynthesis